MSLEHEGVGFDGSSLSAAYHHYVLLSPGAWAAVTQFYGGAMSNRSSLVESLHMSVPRSPVFVRYGRSIASLWVTAYCLCGVSAFSDYAIV